jgi:hypothetical protein
MDPYLEHPALWPDVHNSLIASVRDVLSPQIAPKYYVRLERRTYLLSSDDLLFVGRPDVSVIGAVATESGGTLLYPAAGVIEVTLAIPDEVSDSYLEVHDVLTGKVVTVMELLSPANKLYRQGREEYELKRNQILRSRTNLIEVDLLRAGKPMPLNGKRVESQYRILVSRAATRPRAYLYPFDLRQAIPAFNLPLLPGDNEPALDLGQILHALYDRARYDLSLDYAQPAVPPLGEDDAAWARGQISKRRPEG